MPKPASEELPETEVEPNPTFEKRTRREFAPEYKLRIIDDTRAFYRFLQTNYQLVQADACLDILGGDAVQHLQAAMSDPSGFGIGKSVLTGDGAFNLFDDFPPPSSPGASATKPKPPSKKNKKEKSAAARKTRKKNR